VFWDATASHKSAEGRYKNSLELDFEDNGQVQTARKK